MAKQLIIQGPTYQIGKRLCDNVYEGYQKQPSGYEGPVLVLRFLPEPASRSDRDKLSRRAELGRTACCNSAYLLSNYDFSETARGRWFTVHEHFPCHTLEALKTGVIGHYARISFIAGAVFDGLTQIHEAKFAYTSMSARNMVIGVEGEIKLCHFDDCVSAAEAGTRWTALVAHDLLAFGALLFELTTGVVLSEIGQAAPSEMLARSVPDELRTIILGLLERDPEKQLSASRGRSMTTERQRPYGSGDAEFAALVARHPGTPSAGTPYDPER